MPKKTPAAPTPNAPDFSRERCKQCGICAHFCPKGAIELDQENLPQLVDPEACTGCRLCEYLCPDFGIRMRSNGSDRIHSNGSDGTRLDARDSGDSDTKP